MTTWTSISNASVGVGGIPSSTTMTALRDNSAAMAEAATGAPAIFAGWHPVDKLTVGDGKTGIIYDFTNNGTVAEVVTPAFEDGYEYKIIAHGLQHNDSTTRRLTIEAQKNGSSGQIVQTSPAGSGTLFGIVAEFHMPRVSNFAHLVSCSGHYGVTFANLDQSSTSYDSPAGKIDRAKIVFTVGSIVAGRIWLFRRREYASLS